MTRLTLDSNVYVSALVFGGKPKRLLDLVAEGLLHASVSAPILAEVERVLRTKFLWSQERVGEAVATINAITEIVSATEGLAVIESDPDDDRVRECAVAGQSESVVTGDKDLLALGNFRGVSVITVSQAVAQFDSQSS